MNVTSDGGIVSNETNYPRIGPNDDLLWVEANFLATKRFAEGVTSF